MPGEGSGVGAIEVAPAVDRAQLGRTGTTSQAHSMTTSDDKIVIENLNVAYSDGTESLRNINLRIRAGAISVFFGPAGGGKSTLLRTINRLNDLADVVAPTRPAWL